jgi:hypothetical protein
MGIQDSKFLTVLTYTIILIAAEIFSSINSIYFIVLLLNSHAGSEALICAIYTRIVAGVATIVIGYVESVWFFTSPRILIGAAIILQITGFSLLTVLDYRLNSEDSFRLMPGDRFGYLVPGFLFSQLSISLLEVVGRTNLLRSFASEVQLRVQTLTACLVLGTSSLIHIIFGFVVRGNEGNYLKSSYNRWVLIPFSCIGLVLAVWSAIGMPLPETPTRTIDFKGFTSLEGSTDFFVKATPLFLVLLATSGIEYLAPVNIMGYGVDDDFAPIESLGIGFLAVGLFSLVATAGAWLTKPLGIRSAFIVTVLASILILGIDLFEVALASDHRVSRALAIVDVVFGGTSLGVALAGGWVVIALAMPQGQIGKYVGLFLGFSGVLRGLTPLIDLAGSLTGLIVLTIAAIVGFVLPDNGEQPAQVGYDGINAS